MEPIKAVLISHHTLKVCSKYLCGIRRVHNLYAEWQAGWISQLTISLISWLIWLFSNQACVIFYVPRIYTASGNLNRQSTNWNPVHCRYALWSATLSYLDGTLALSITFRPEQNCPQVLGRIRGGVAQVGIQIFKKRMRGSSHANVKCQTFVAQILISSNGMSGIRRDLSNPIWIDKIPRYNHFFVFWLSHSEHACSLGASRIWMSKYRLVGYDSEQHYKGVIAGSLAYGEVQRWDLRSSFYTSTYFPNSNSMGIIAIVRPRRFQLALLVLEMGRKSLQLSHKARLLTTPHRCQVYPPTLYIQRLPRAGYSFFIKSFAARRFRPG